jgi:dCMP deaminase
MCKRMILNAGISTVIIRDDSENFRVIDTKDWIDNDDSLTGDFGY